MFGRSAEKALRAMGQSIHRSGTGHHFRQGSGIVGISQSQHREDLFVVETLLPAIWGGDDGNLGNFTAGTGGGSHCHDFQRFAGPVEGIELLLGQSGIGCQNRNALCRIQRRTSADSQDKIRTGFNGFPGCDHAVGKFGILANFIKQQPLLAVSVQGIRHILQGTAEPCGFFSGYDQAELAHLGKFLCTGPDTACTGHQFYRHIRIQIHWYSSLFDFIIAQFSVTAAKNQEWILGRLPRV